jgi:regulator of RNase E activity RraA
MIEDRTLSPEKLAELRKFDTPTVCNVIELFELRPQNAGFTNSTIKANLPDLPPVVGYAATATHRSAAPQRPEDQYTGFPTQLEKLAEIPGPKVAVYQDLDDPHVGAVFGEVMCSCLKKFGCIGLITNGPGRDMEQVQNLGFPTFTNGIVCAHGYPSIADINIPVCVGGITVRPGDLIHADLNGVTIIPIEIAGAVPDLCQDLMDVETTILAKLKEDCSASDVKEEFLKATAGFKLLREKAQKFMKNNGIKIS